MYLNGCRAGWHGEKFGTLQFDGLKLSEISYPENSRIPAHSHEFPYFLLVREGSFSQRYRARSHDYEPSTLIYMRSDETHADRFHRHGARCFVVELGEPWTKRLNDGTVFADTGELRNGVAAWLATRLHHEFSSPDAASSLAIEGLALELLVEVSRNNTRTIERRPPAWLSAARDMLHEQFADNFTIESIARAANVHPSHLSRAFRQHLGCTVGDYVRKLRLEFACREILATDVSLTQIAHHAGFHDHSHFSRTFKQMIGLSPSQYRAAFRKR